MKQLTLPQQVARMDGPRLQAYRENLEFYRGTQWREGPRRGERRLTLNYAKAFVEKVTSYLMSGVLIYVDADDSSDSARERAQRAQHALRDIYRRNNLVQLDFDTELDAAILGDGCFKVTWDSSEQRVRVSAPDVQGVFAWWLGDDVNRIWRIASRYTLSADEASLLYGVSIAAEEATILEVWTVDRFQLWIDEAQVEDRRNPYGFIPFVIYPNLREPKQFWGVSDIEAIREPSRELNRALSHLSTIIELSGNPIAVLENVEQAEDIAVQPGAVWELPERARAYLLDLLQGGGVRHHIDYIDCLFRALHDLSESPRTAFGDNRQGLSGVALEMELHPIVQKVRRKQLIRSAAYCRRAEMILSILEQKGGERYLPCRPRIEWGPVLPPDRSRLVHDEQVLVEAGLHSRRRAMAELGIENPDEELEYLRSEVRP